LNISELTTLNFIEIIGVVTGVICVYLNFREHIIGWPIGIVSVVCYAIVFFHQKLYADMGLQFFYIGMNIYGWYMWYAKKKATAIQVIRIRFNQGIYIGIFILLFGSALSYILKLYTDASLPLADAFLCAGSLAAQYLLAKKIIENWLLWIVIDLCYVGMFLQKELYPTAFLYLIFTALAIWAYIVWRKKLISTKGD